DGRRREVGGQIVIALVADPDFTGGHLAEAHEGSLVRREQAIGQGVSGEVGQLLVADAGAATEHRVARDSVVARRSRTRCRKYRNPVAAATSSVGKSAAGDV